MLKKNNSNKTIIDTSPLLLILIGSYDKNLLGKFKRVRNYNEEDFEILFQYLLRKEIIITPQILAEVSNFAEELGDEKFKQFINKNKDGLKKLNEFYIKKDDIFNTEEVLKLGFTDTSIFLFAKNKNAEVLTADRKLWNVCRDQKSKINAVHIDDLFRKEKQLL